MFFNSIEIEELKELEIYVDKREYSTGELWVILYKVGKDKINEELYNKIKHEIYGPPIVTKWTSKNLIPKYIKKENVKTCPQCNDELQIIKDMENEELYKCKKCKYSSYIIKNEIEEKLKLNDTVRLKGYRNEGKIVEIINDNEYMVEFDDAKIMRELVCSTMYSEFLDKIEKGECTPTHIEKRNIDELLKVI